MRYNGHKNQARMKPSDAFNLLMPKFSTAVHELSSVVSSLTSQTKLDTINDPRALASTVVSMVPSVLIGNYNCRSIEDLRLCSTLTCPRITQTRKLFRGVNCKDTFHTASVLFFHLFPFCSPVPPQAVIVTPSLPPAPTN